MKLTLVNQGKGFLFVGLMSFMYASESANAFSPPELRHFLRRFVDNSKLVMNELPVKIDPTTGKIVKGDHYALEEFVRSRDYLLIKDRVRRKIIRQNVKGGPGSYVPRISSQEYAPIEANDEPKNLVDDASALMNLQEIEQAGLLSAELSESPWSDYYWPIYNGILGARYADEAYPSGWDWQKNYSYISAFPAANIFATGDTLAIQNLSPSEKYELIVGDTQGVLTEKMWTEGKFYYDRYGEVEKWFGICHGWAPASYMSPRPRRSVKVLAAGGSSEVTFYPSDIKALTTLLWANTNYATKFLGGRCNDKDPAHDENGRTLSSQCFDNNPASMHRAIVAQIGLAKRSLVMDASFDFEVWNQPIYAYKYSYFNPESKLPTSSLQEATVARDEFISDKFRDYRSAQATHMVGINFEVTYMVETAPSHRPSDDPKFDALRRVSYVYDLELDERGNIVGGEWYTNFHPDFLWTPPKDTRAQTGFELHSTEPWLDNRLVPKSWMEGAVQAARRGQPLAKIVEKLIALSRR